MPNWVFNKVYFYGEKERIEKLKKFVESEEMSFDFNKIVPMPEELNLISGSDEDVARSCALARRRGQTTSAEYEKYGSWNLEVKKSFDEWADLGEKYLSNIEKYGASTWYDWHCTHWGTKWNASEPIWYGDNMVTFDTAWSAPEPIFQKLAELFPDIDIDVDFADEDLGNNCGQITCREGQYEVEYVNSFEFACDVWGYDPEEMKEEYEEM